VSFSFDPVSVGATCSAPSGSCALEPFSFLQAAYCQGRWLPCKYGATNSPVRGRAVNMTATILITRQLWTGRLPVGPVESPFHDRPDCPVRDTVRTSVLGPI
jgi:hypothetical protein